MTEDPIPSRPDVHVLVLSATLPPPTVAALRARYACHGLGDPGAIARAIEAHGPRIRAIAVTGKEAVDRALLARLPALEIVSNFSAGYDRIDVAALGERRVILTNTSVALADDVADLALALILMTRRRLVAADRFVREGRWANGAFPLGRSAKGARLGMLGIGNIGLAVARRAAVLGMQIAYCARRRRGDLDFPHHADVRSLAAASDVLIVACPGGAETRHLVNSEVIEALGPDGALVNVARGSVVDELALTEALAAGRLGAAGLDVYEDSPRVPPALRALDNVVLLPHLGSATAETRQAMGDLVVANLDAHFAGAPVLTAVNM